MESTPEPDRVEDLAQLASTIATSELQSPRFITIHLPRLPGDEIIHMPEPSALQVGAEAAYEFDILAVTQEARRHFAIATYTRIMKGDADLIDKRVASANVIGMETLIMVQKAWHHRFRYYAV